MSIWKLKTTAVTNPVGFVYIDGNKTTEGSIRIGVDSETGFAVVEKLIDGLWQPSSLETGANSLWVGHNVGIAGVGHHLATEATDGHLHFHANSSFNGQLTEGDTQILYADYYTAYMAVQPDESGEFTGQSFEYTHLTTSHALLETFYIKTGAIPASSPIRFQVWEGTNDTGVVIFDQYYPASIFIANTEIPLTLNGKLEYGNNTNYFFRLSSTSNFSLKTNVGETQWTLAIAFSRVREDKLLQTKPWVSGDTWNSGDYIIDNRKIYICNVTGVQTGTFAGNSAKWDLLSSTASDYWNKTGNNLNYNDGNVGIGISTFPEDENLYVYKDFAGTTKIKVENPDTGDSSANIQVKSDSCGVNLRAFGSGYTGTPDGVWLDAFNNSGPLTIKSGSSIILRTGINTEALLVGDDGTLVFNDGTRDRVTVTSSITKLLSGNGTFEIKATGSEASMGYSQTYLRLTSESLIYRDGGSDRIKILTGESIFKSPDSNQLITLNNSGIALPVIATDLTLGANQHFSVADSKVYASDDVGYLQFGISGTLSWNDGSVNRIYSGTTLTELSSPDGESDITTGNSGVYLTSRGYAGLDIDASSTKLWSPDNNYSFEVKNTIIDAQTTHFNIGDGTRTRFDTKTDRTGLWCPDGNDWITLTNTGTIITTNSNVDIKSGTQTRLRINSTDTELISPTEQYNLLMQDGFVHIWDGSRNRVVISNTTSQLLSPDGNNEVAITNSGTDITGPTSVCGGLGSDSFRIKPYSATYSGGSMVLEGTGDGASGTYSSYNIDNFWGYLRIYAGATGSKYVRMSNVGEGATDLMHLNIDGSIIAGVVSGFKTASAGIELRSTTEAFLLSRMTTTERDALTAVNGMTLYNITTNKFQGYQNSAWVDLA